MSGVAYTTAALSGCSENRKILTATRHKTIRSKIIHNFFSSMGFSKGVVCYIYQDEFRLKGFDLNEVDDLAQC